MSALINQLTDSANDLSSKIQKEMQKPAEIKAKFHRVIQKFEEIQRDHITPLNALLEESGCGEFKIEIDIKDHEKEIKIQCPHPEPNQSDRIFSIQVADGITITAHIDPDSDEIEQLHFVPDNPTQNNSFAGRLSESVVTFAKKASPIANREAGIISQLPERVDSFLSRTMSARLKHKTTQHLAHKKLSAGQSDIAAQDPLTPD